MRATSGVFSKEEERELSLSLWCEAGAGPWDPGTSAGKSWVAAVCLAKWGIPCHGTGGALVLWGPTPPFVYLNGKLFVTGIHMLEAPAP